MGREEFTMNQKNIHCTRLSWDEWYLLAKEYYEANNSLKIPSKYKTDDGHLLGRWIERQRAAYRHKGTYRIDARRIYLLNQIGMIWSLEIRTDWDTWYSYAKEYFAEHGNINLPRNTVYRQLPLGEWISYQRKRYGQSKMDCRQRYKLEELNITWKLRKRRRWIEWYQDAKLFYETNGHLNVLPDYSTKEGYRLGYWINAQRERQRGIRSFCLDDEKVEKLNQIGMMWGLRSLGFGEHMNTPAE